MKATGHDPARGELLRALDQLEHRIDAATGGIVRCVCGGSGWNSEHTRRYRVDLARAVEELDAVTRALTMLDGIDAEIGGRP